MAKKEPHAKEFIEQMDKAKELYDNNINIEDNEIQASNIEPVEITHEAEIVSEAELMDNVEDIDNLQETKPCSFEITINNFNKFLTYIKCKGSEGISKTVTDLITDCILRFDEKTSTMWSIITDISRTIVVQVKVKVANIKNPIDIPIDIKDLDKWLESFDSNDTIEMIYENGVIALKNKITEKMRHTGNISHTSVLFLTKRKETVINDLILNLEYGGEIDAKKLSNTRKFGNSIYKIEKNVLYTFFDVKMSNVVYLSATQLQKIISDGERLDNRQYPFEFTKKYLKITVKCIDESIRDSITRTIYPEKYNVSNEFMVTFASRLTNAVKNISGIVSLYVDDNCPMALIPVIDKETEIDVCYIIVNV